VRLLAPGAVFAELEKARLAAKLKAAREAQGKLGGRKGYAEAKPTTVAPAKALHAEACPIAGSLPSLPPKAI
jgi:hypothetical protein